MGMVPKSTKSDVKIWHNLGLLKCLGFAATIIMCFLLSSILFSSEVLKIGFMIFSGIVYIICNIKSPTDPNKIFLKGLSDFLKFKIRSKDIYGNNSTEFEIYSKECEKIEAKKAKIFKRKKAN